MLLLLVQFCITCVRLIKTFLIKTAYLKANLWDLHNVGKNTTASTSSATSTESIHGALMRYMYNNPNRVIYVPKETLFERLMIIVLFVINNKWNEHYAIIFGFKLHHRNTLGDCKCFEYDNQTYLVVESNWKFPRTFWVGNYGYWLQD